MKVYVKDSLGWKNSNTQYVRAQSDNELIETPQSGAFIKMTEPDRPIPFTVSGNGLGPEVDVIDENPIKVYDNNDNTGLWMGSNHRWEGGHQATCLFGYIRIKPKKITLKTGGKVNEAVTTNVTLLASDGSEITVWSRTPSANSTYEIIVPTEKQVEIKGIRVSSHAQPYQRIEIKSCQITEWILVERKAAWRKVVKKYIKRANEDVQGILHFSENFYDKYRDYGITLSGKYNCFESINQTWGSTWTNYTDDSGYMYFGSRRIVPKIIEYQTGTSMNEAWNFYVYGIKEDGSEIIYLNGANTGSWTKKTINISDTTPIKGIRFRQTASPYNRIDVQYCKILQWEEPGTVTAWQEL